MVDAMHYKVIKKQLMADKYTIAYLFESDGGRWFSAMRSPDDVVLEVGDVLKHYIGNIWHTKEKASLTIDGSLVCSTKEEAEKKFAELVA